MQLTATLTPRQQAEFQHWARRLESTASTEQGPWVKPVLDSVESFADGNSAGVKKELREQLWRLRESNPDAVYEVRQSYEKLRNLSLDHSEGYPSQRYTVQQRPSPAEIPNFQVVHGSYWRGGQPDQEGLYWLRDQGVRTQIDLREEDRGNAWCPPSDYPLKVTSIAVKDFGNPTFEQVEEFLQQVNNPENHPVFVHCKAGVGRTGVMTACWRISQGMSAQQALDLESIHSPYGSLKQEAFVREFEAYWLGRTQS